MRGWPVHHSQLMQVSRQVDWLRALETGLGERGREISELVRQQVRNETSR